MSATKTWERVAGLELTIDSYELEGLQAFVSSEFERKSTIVRMHGGGHEGAGEDVTYDAVDHEILQAAGATLPLAGRFTIGSFSEHLATLDLALRQAGLALHELLGREPQPVRFVVSLRLGEPPSMDPVYDRLEQYPSLRFKLDPTSSWEDPLIVELAATGSVESVDFKAYYSGSIVDQAPDPALYRRVAEAFPLVWIEDPALTEETDRVLRIYRDNFSWDAPIHSIADIEALKYPPKMVNIKPSRLGGLRNLLDTFDYCAEHRIRNYGGGQFELGVGRGQIQYLASLFHPNAPNDVAPSGYNLPKPPPGLPLSPLAPQPSATGFRWGES